ncbi:MAG: hypothetical protein ACI85U_002701 [Candidatus Promineifilaceae bacterium]
MVFKTFMRHHMAPMASCVTDTEQNRFVLLSGGLKRLIPPRVPMNGVIGVLEQIGGGFSFKVIHEGTMEQYLISNIYFLANPAFRLLTNVPAAETRSAGAALSTA